MFWHSFCLAAMLLSAVPVAAAPVTTRASHLGGTAVGMGKLLHMADYLKEYPGSRTAILTYFKMDSMDVEELVSGIRIQAGIQNSMGREFWPQIALETDKLGLVAFQRELGRAGSRLDRTIRALAREIAHYRDQNKWFFIRPFSEMNDATENTPWEFGARSHHNTPADLAAAWKLLRDRFNEEGATNAIWVFSPLAAYGMHREQEVLDALNRIPVGAIDAFGLNLYSRPPSGYSGSSPVPIPFATLARPWLNVLARSRHKGIPLAVAEMAVSSQASDPQRARWLRETFQFTRAKGFVMVTYFNFPHRYWHVDENSQAGAVLNKEMNAAARKQTDNNSLSATFDSRDSRD